MARTNKSSNYNRSLYKSRIYRIWYNIKTRCNNKNTINYHIYGGRGISYDEKWEKFQTFYDDMKNGYSDNLQIDRIDNNGNYCKENCRWATIRENSNNRNNNRIIEFKGAKNTLANWSRIVGVKYSTLRQRYYVYKWSIERCLTHKH